MDKYQKETYLKANEYYQNGEYEKARRLWESLHGKNILNTPHSLLWKNINISFAQNKIIFFVLFFAIGLLASVLYGRLNYVVYILFYEFIQYKKSPELFIFFIQRSTVEHEYLKALAENAHFYNPLLLIQDLFVFMSNYLVTKFGQVHLQISYLFSIQEGVLNFKRGLSNTFFILPLSFLVYAFSVFFDLYLVYKFFRFVWSAIKNIAASKILLKRLFVCYFSLFFLTSYYYIVYTHFVKEKTNSFDLMSMFNGGGGEAQDRQDKKEMSESEFLDDLLKKYLDRPMSLKEREQAQKIMQDIQKAMQMMKIKGSGSKMSDEMLQMILDGDYQKILEQLKKMKANDNLKKLSERSGVELNEKDKEFSDVLKQSFKNSSQKTLEEFMKTSKELNELYGKEVHEQVFGNSSEKEMMQKFMNDPEGAKKEMREAAKKAIRKESGNILQVQDTRTSDVKSEMNAIINYLEGGGDIKIFNQMRLKFLEKYPGANIKFFFAKKLDFVIASWTEHQNKYFWQMNRELMLELIDMVKSSAAEIGYDVRGLNLGWFYLVAGDYKEARSHCLASANFNEARQQEMAYVNRSNAALAALMLGQGREAYVEYKNIQRAVFSKTGFSRRDREEYFIEYLREITAALASPNPCIESFLCRSLFLEGVDDDLAIKDLVRYLALSPSDDLLVKEAEIKIRLIKERLENTNVR